MRVVTAKKIRPARPDDAPDIIVCSPVAEAMELPGSVVKQCPKCGQDVRMARSGQDLLKRFPKLGILCLPCALPNIEEAGENDLLLPPGNTFARDYGLDN